jgi:hypothetical protein
MDMGKVLSSRTHRTYSTILEALISGERLRDIEISWDCAPEKAKLDNLDNLYDERLSQLRGEYDIMELSWGGGYDSSYLLEVAVRNDISFDIISMIGYRDIDHPATMNLELKNNYYLIGRYLERFPGTEVKFIDLAGLWDLARQDHSRDKWLKSYPTLDDICGLYCDAFLGREAVQNRCLVTGKGWKNITYNSEYRMWSMYHTANDQYTRLAHTSVCDYVPFYATTDIVTSACFDAMKLTPDRNKSWTPTGSWMQENVLYPGFDHPIWKVSKGFVNHFSCSKMDWFYNNGRPAHPELHREYWTWLDKCNDKIHIEDLGGKRMPEGFYVEQTKIVDFYRE